MISFKNINKVYSDGTNAVNNLSFEVEKGQFTTIIGPSGCGKTTTLKMINRLIEPSSGHIFIENRDIRDYDIHELRWNIGYVLQEIALFPHMTIEENISIVPDMKKWSKKKMKERSRELLELVGLDPSIYEKRKPEELSGGEQQRIGVIRALAADPNIILMDEPFSALDPISRENLQTDIKTLQKEIKKTIIFVTHDMNEATALGDKICLMRDGEIIQYDTPENLILNPINEFVKQFIGNKESPWQTAVGVIADRNNEFIKNENEWRQIPSNSQQTVILKDNNGNYINMVKNSEIYDGETLTSDMSLYEATEIFKTSDQQLFPVIKNERLIGALTYRDIVVYLRNHSDIRTGSV